MRVQPQLRTFIGVDLGGGKGKNTAVAQLRLVDDTPDGAPQVEVVDYGTGRDSAYYDDHLLEYLRKHGEALVAIDAPLCLPSCLFEDAETARPVTEWFARRSSESSPYRKPQFTPYTQRPTEVLLHERNQEILARETLGQGMGPLTARGVFLARTLAPQFRLDENLIEVYPKATLIQLVGKKLATSYKRSAREKETRLAILNSLPDLRFGPGQWKQFALENDHKFDAVICAYTAYLYARGACIPPTDEERAYTRDGWIWIPALRGAD